MEVDSNLYAVSVKIPFPSRREAEIAYDVLRVDAEPKRNFIQKNITVKDNLLIVDLRGTVAKSVRVSLTSLFENIILCCETMEAFGPPAENYDFY